MRADHERIASVALGAAGEFGFILAGGYAISAHGVGSRLSDDVDLFTNRTDPRIFSVALAAVERALIDAGYSTTVERRGEVFARLTVTQAHGDATTLDMAVDYRLDSPATLQVGPTLSLADAAGSKLVALYGRGEPRDYLDVYALVDSGRTARAELLELADRREASPLDRRILADQLRGVAAIPASLFAVYGIDQATIGAMVADFTQWADHIEAQQR